MTRQKYPTFYKSDEGIKSETHDMLHLPLERRECVTWKNAKKSCHNICVVLLP